MVIVKSYFYIVKNRHILEKTDILKSSCDSGFVDLDGAFPVMSWPSSLMIPSVGLYTPVRRLNTVVLPAPLGPISP